MGLNESIPEHRGMYVVVVPYDGVKSQRAHAPKQVSKGNYTVALISTGRALPPKLGPAAQITFTQT